VERENGVVASREGGQRLRHRLASPASQLRDGVLKQRWGAMTRRKGLVRVGEGERDVSPMSDGRRRRRRPWPAGTV